MVNFRYPDNGGLISYSARIERSANLINTLTSMTDEVQICRIGQQINDAQVIIDLLVLMLKQDPNWQKKIKTLMNNLAKSRKSLSKKHFQAATVGFTEEVVSTLFWFAKFESDILPKVVTVCLQDIAKANTDNLKEIRECYRALISYANFTPSTADRNAINAGELKELVRYNSDQRKSESIELSRISTDPFERLHVCCTNLVSDSSFVYVARDNLSEWIATLNTAIKNNKIKINCDKWLSNLKSGKNKFCDITLISMVAIATIFSKKSLPKNILDCLKVKAHQAIFFNSIIASLNSISLSNSDSKILLELEFLTYLYRNQSINEVLSCSSPQGPNFFSGNQSEIFYMQKIKKRIESLSTSLITLNADTSASTSQHQK